MQPRVNHARSIPVNHGRRTGGQGEALSVRGERLIQGLAAAGTGALFVLALCAHAVAQQSGLSSIGLRTGLDDAWVDSTRPSSAGAIEDERRARERGATRRRPVFGNPPGFGAGKTGYVSTNPSGAIRRPGQDRRRRGQERASPLNDGGPARPGSPPTGPSRPGASIDIPADTLTRLIRRPEEDAFAPVGIRLGTFVLRPAIEVTGGYDSNPGRDKGGRGSSVMTVAPELQVRSDWSRHALDADLRGTYTSYGSMGSLNRPYFDGRAKGRIDVTRQTQIDIEARTTVSTDNPGSPDLPADLARLPLYATVGGGLGLTHRFNRFEITTKGNFDRTAYQDSVLTDGSVVSNRDRNYDQYTAQFRLAYELNPAMKPFAEVQQDFRVRDLAVDAFGVQRDSRGTTLRLGTTFEVSRKLTGEFSIGYLMRTYKDPTLPDLTGLIADGSLIWSMTGLTNVRLTAKSTADETTLPGVSGVLRRDIGVQVDHAFRRWLIGTARLGYGMDTYDGATRKDERYVAAAAITYKLSRTIQIKGELRQEWLRSNEPDNDYTASIALVGLRLQR